MIIAQKKYFKMLTWFVLVVNIGFLFVASFHSHHIEYFSKSQFSKNIPNSNFVEPAVCLFNQINKPTYFFLNAEYSSFNFYKAEIFSPTPSYQFFHSRTLYSLSNLRAPPTVI
ncbi:MAG: hypothetical protein ACYC4T_00225 [Melioribacteraceae bacterium]